MNHIVTHNTKWFVIIFLKLIPWHHGPWWDSVSTTRCSKHLGLSSFIRRIMWLCALCSMSGKGTPPSLPSWIDMVIRLVWVGSILPQLPIITLSSTVSRDMFLRDLDGIVPPVRARWKYDTKHGQIKFHLILMQWRIWKRKKVMLKQKMSVLELKNKIDLLANHFSAATYYGLRCHSVWDDNMNEEKMWNTTAGIMHHDVINVVFQNSLCLGCILWALKKTSS